MRVEHFWHQCAFVSHHQHFYTVEFVAKECPWASDIVEVDGGIIAFESPVDALKYAY